MHDGPYAAVELILERCRMGELKKTRCIMYLKKAPGMVIHWDELSKSFLMYLFFYLLGGIWLHVRVYLLVKESCTQAVKTVWRCFFISGKLFKPAAVAFGKV